MNYVLWNDKCSDCQYISNAFIFLRLPLTHHPISAASATTFECPPNAVVFLCQHSQTNYRDTILSYASQNKCSFVVCSNKATNQSLLKLPLYYLKMPFHKYDLKDVMSLCYDYYYKNGEGEDLAADYACMQQLVGKCDAIMHIKKLIQKVATLDSTVLIQGQSGTGKDVIANCIHQISSRNKSPFVPINCGAIPAELLESELFGYEKGAFTGASARRLGRFEMAQNGTLFLDEIGEMPFAMQVKLLRVLQERKIERIGGNTAIDVNIRVIAATNKNIEDLIAANQFREDLFYRLNVFPIQVPSLAERQDDIPLLIDYHLEKIYERIEHKTFFSEKAKKILSQQPWPGNIRELQNFLERMVILYPDTVINDKMLSTFIKATPKNKTGAIANTPTDRLVS